MPKQSHKEKSRPIFPPPEEWDFRWLNDEDVGMIKHCVWYEYSRESTRLFLEGFEDIEIACDYSGRKKGYIQKRGGPIMIDSGGKRNIPNWEGCPGKSRPAWIGSIIQKARPTSP